MVRERLLKAALKTMASRAHDFAIGPKDEPYMLRWWIIPRNKWFNIYLHKFYHDDEDRALHDHPWASCSIILEGGYFENFDWGRVWRGEGSVTLRRATKAHRISLSKILAPNPVSLFITGPVIRTWGFHCPKGWVPWHKFVDLSDTGSVGRGCDQ
jgi:hypothetical protein